MKTVSLRELKRFADHDLAGCVTHLTEAMEAGHIKPRQLSIRDLFEALIPDGTELLRLIGPGKSGRAAMNDISLLEAAGAVDTSAFATISGQMIFNATKEAFSMDTFIWPDLCTTVPTSFIHGEIVPGIGGLGDVAEIIMEGAEYPTVGVNEEYTKTAPTQKRGFIVPVTREAIIMDRTGLVLDRCAQGGEWLGLNKEKQVQDVCFGIINNYNRNGTSYNTYLTSGAYINDKTGNALSGSGNEWTALQTLEILASAILDPNTNEPISTKPDTIIVPVALRRTAGRILNATSIEQVDLTTNSASTIRTTSPNPYGPGEFKILSNNWVKLRTGSATKWFFGSPKRAIKYMQAWDIETQQAAPNNFREFNNDIWMQQKVSMRGVAQMMEPRYMLRSDA